MLKYILDTLCKLLWSWRHDFWTPLTWNRPGPHRTLHFYVFHAIPYYSMLFHAFPLYSMLFHAIPCYSMLFHAIPFYSMLFHAIPYYSMHNPCNPWHPCPNWQNQGLGQGRLGIGSPIGEKEVLWASRVGRYSISNAIPLYSMLFHAIPRYSMLFMLFHAISCYSMLFHA